MDPEHWFKLKITLDRHSPRLKLKYCLLPDPPLYSLLSIPLNLYFDADKPDQVSWCGLPDRSGQRPPQPEAAGSAYKGQKVQKNGPRVLDFTFISMWTRLILV